MAGPYPEADRAEGARADQYGCLYWDDVQLHVYTSKQLDAPMALYNMRLTYLSSSNLIEHCVIPHAE